MGRPSPGDSDGRRDEKTYPRRSRPRGERVVGVTEASGIEVTGIGVSVPFGPVVVRCVVAVHLFVIGSGVPSSEPATTADTSSSYDAPESA